MTVVVGAFSSLFLVALVSMRIFHSAAKWPARAGQGGDY